MSTTGGSRPPGLRRGLVAVAIASTIVTGVVQAARIPWTQQVRQDDAPIEVFIDAALRRIPPDAPVCLITELFGPAYAVRFYPRPVIAPLRDPDAVVAAHPEAWIVKFSTMDFDPASSYVEAPRARR